MTSKTRSLETEISLAASVEAVWEALTKAEELVRWFPLEAGESPDDSLWMSWGDGFRFEGRASEVDPPRRFRFVHRQPPPGRDPSSLMLDEFAEIATESVLDSQGAVRRFYASCTRDSAPTPNGTISSKARGPAGRLSSAGSGTISRTTAAETASWPVRKRLTP
jgi:uncharacterized protein YndB with AHSA1/START domain